MWAQTLKALIDIRNRRTEWVFLVGVELKSRGGRELTESLAELAELAVDDLIELTGMDTERAKTLIMAARAPWFA